MKAYPNPFNASTTIRYSIPAISEVSIVIYDIAGRKVATLIDKIQPAGYYQTMWNAIDFPSGIYFYKLTTGEKVLTKEMVLIK